MATRENKQATSEEKAEQFASAVNFGAAQFGAGAAALEASGTDAMIQGMDTLTRVFSHEGGNPNKFGNLFETIEAAKFNVDAARKGSSLNAQVTAAPSDPLLTPDRTAAADILIRSGGKTVREVQAKCSDPNTQHGDAWMADQMRKDKYHGQQRVVPKDREPKVRELTKKRADSESIYAEEYKDSYDNLSGDTHHENITSGGTSSHEVKFSNEHPKLHAGLMEAKQLSLETSTAAKKAAASAAIVTGSISLCKYGMQYYDGKIDADEAIRLAAKDTGTAAARSAATGGTGGLLRYGASKAAKKMGKELAARSGATALTKSNVATAVATAVIDTGVAIYSFAKGDISAEDCMEQMGQTGFTMVGGLYFGAVGNSAAVALGATGFALTAIPVAVSMGGFLVATYAYQSCVAILVNARLAEEEAARIEAICAESIRQMQEQRQAFERAMDQALQRKEAQINDSMASLHEALSRSDLPASLSALGDLACACGVALKFPTFAAFDEMMLSDEPLRF